MPSSPETGPLHPAEAPEDVLRFWDLARELFCVIDGAGVFLRVNPAWTRILGWSEAELLGRPALELLHPDDLEATRRAWDTDDDASRLEEFRNRFRHRDGSVRWLGWTGYRHGEHWYGVARDVTATRTSHEALQRSERRSRAMLAALREGLLIFDSQGRIVEANERFADMIGLSPREIVDARPPFPWWPPEDRAHLAEVLAETVSGARRQLELTFMHRDGRRFPVVIDEADLPERDGRAAALAVIRDVTELVSTRDRLAEAHRVAGLTSWELFPDEDLIIVYADPLRNGPQATWTTTIEESLEPVLEPSRSELRRLRMETLDGTRDDFVLDIATAEGNRAAFAEVRGEPMRDPDGRIRGLRGTVQDITARKRAQLDAELQGDVIDALGVAVIAHAPDGRLVHVSDAAIRMLGWPREELLGRRRREVPIAAQEEPEVQAMFAALDAGDPWDGELNLLCGDGSRVRVHIRTTAVRDAAGQVQCIAGIIEEVARPQ